MAQQTLIALSDSREHDEMIDTAVLPLSSTMDPPRSAEERPLAGGSADHDLTVVETVQLVEETFSVSKREVLAGTVRVSTTTDSVQEIAEIALERTIADVTRVPIGQIVEVAPSVRTDGATTIVPILEERYVVVKQLYLKEELHVRHHVETEISHVPVVLRRQTAVVDRLDAEGRVLSGPTPHP